jgi:hypothetical protein
VDEENQVPNQKTSRSQANSREESQEVIGQFVVFVEDSVEDTVPQKLVTSANGASDDDATASMQTNELKDLFMCFAACGSAQASMSNKLVDTATARSSWFLNEADLLGLKSIQYLNNTKNFDLQDIILRSLRKYGRETLLKMIEANHDRGSFPKDDQDAQVWSVYIKNKMDQYPDELKTQVYVDMLTSLEETFQENGVELARAELDRDIKCHELHLELVADEPCPLRRKARLMRYGWSKDKVKKLDQAREDLKRQIRSLAEIHSEILSITPDTHTRRLRANSRVFVDSTNKTRPPYPSKSTLVLKGMAEF